MSFSIDITGDLNVRLDEITAEIKQELKQEMIFFGQDVVEMASNLAPVNFGVLRETIYSVPLEEPAIGVQILCLANYAAFLEFGSGLYAAAYVPSLPKELQEYAMTFYVDGSGRVPAKPFLWPSIELNLIALRDRLKTIFNA